MNSSPSTSSKNQWQIVLAGAGGQGQIYAGTLLAEAAVLKEGKYATQTQSYGVASRGGFSKSDVIISDEPVAFPYVRRPDIVLALTQEAYDRYRSSVDSHCLFVYDSDTISGGQSAAREVGLPLTSTARASVGLRALNMVALGAILRLAPVVSVAALEETLKGRAKPSVYQTNWKGFLAGYELAAVQAQGVGNAAK